MIEITINGEVFKAKTYDCHLVTIEIGDRTQTLDGTDHVEGRKLKRYITAGFTDLSKPEARRLLQAVYSTTYINVTYNDTFTDSVKTGVFILQNDPSVPVKVWRNLKYFEGTVIELKEKGVT